MVFYSDRKLTQLASSVSLFAITIGLVVSQSATHKSLAQTSKNIGNGAGASTVNTLFTGLKGFTFTYSPVGSGAGLTAFFTQKPPAGTPSPITFAASDDPVAGTETVTGGRGYVQVPVVGVGITLAYNASGLTVPAGLKLSQASYCGILNGSITNWNDKSISADNGGQIAVNVPIKVVRRADSSGSTFILSSHLNTVCKTPNVPAANVWKNGAGTTVNWPNTFLSATGGGKLADTVASTKGAIGYVDNATRVSKTLPAAILRNKAGKYVPVSPAAITAAIKDGTVVTYGTGKKLTRIDNLTNPSSASAYPISGVTYLLYYSNETGFQDFIKAANGLAASLGYGPLP
ncbi:substrate-binding domain-containing protein [Nostoc sp. ChiVER01]|uniref:substrate-binding domain-containing protein n=1 Tax=Nostoc sp. ChiVER01 TaxID=3075382 RepID=UPI002AD33CD9|nr:substrate-binding domain-containing protein [Nostoc sp. ChiVER01]MDZ8222075.1 substrate-binding domain-containing protein [Nostoc sp. ChiVER01]